MFILFVSICRLYICCMYLSIQAILVYASAFYSNMGNYKSFGDTKFIPDISSDKFHSLITSCEAYKQDKQAIDNLWDIVSEKIYSLQPTERELGFKPEVITLKM